MEKQSETATQQKKIPSPENQQKAAESSPDVVTPTTPSSSSNWWGGWISQAKEKSASVFEAVKNDINEITTAVSDTFHVTPTEDEPESSSPKHQQHPNTVNYMKQSISSFFGTVTDALIPQIDEEDVAEAVLITSDDTIVLTGFAKHLADLQNNDETFLEEPSKTTEFAEKYKMWLEIVEQDQFTQQRVNKMLESSQILNEKYNKLVPDTVSHMNFFKRYLFKKALLEDDLANDERRRKEVVIAKQPETVAVIEPQDEKVDEPVLPVLPTLAKMPVRTKTTEIGDLDIANFELSEAEQARLLEDYEQEIKEREKTKPEAVEAVPSTTKSAIKSSKNPTKSSSNVQSSKGKNNKNVKLSQQKQQKSTQQQTTKGNEKEKKADAALEMQKDHFKKESESSTSDESWEKEFDL